MLTIKELFYRIRESHIKPGPQRLHRLLGEEYFQTLSFAPVILIGGTNGKGTTCAFLESILRYSGFKTGLYTSPHLVQVTERIRISGIPVTEKELLDTIEKLDTNRQHFLPDATFFELMTAAAFLLFYEKKVDVIVCEVGLGGRFDSTNALCPLVSVLTGVSLDHTQILGKRVSTIAADKSYISRRNKAFIVNHNIPQEALKTISKVAHMIGSKMTLTSQTMSSNLEQIFFEFKDHNAKENLRTTLTVVDCLMSSQTLSSQTLSSRDYMSSRGLTAGSREGPLDPAVKPRDDMVKPRDDNVLNDIFENIRKGIKNSFWPGRFDIRLIKDRTVIFDCAHNPGGVKFFLKQYSKSAFSQKKYNLIFASLKDKDWKQNVSLLAPFAESIKIIQIKNERAQNAKSIFTYVRKKFPLTNISVGSNLKLSIDKLLNNKSTNPLLIIGSIAFVGVAFESLNINVFPT